MKMLLFVTGLMMFIAAASAQIPSPDSAVIVMINESRADVDASGNAITTYSTLLRGFDNETAAEAGLVTLASVSTYNITRTPCSQAASVTNCAQTCNSNTTTGIYQCSCNSGYNDTSTGTQSPSTEVQPGFTCTDIDECTNTTICGPGQATCNNTAGSYACTCNSGYTLASSSQYCDNVDECANSTLNNCDSNANCTDTDGAFTCACNSGYTGNGTSCADTDECAASSITCGGNGNCTNQVGGYTCACNAGYALNSTASPLTCDDVDECAANGSICHAQATCANNAGSYTCTCNAGYSGDGTTCTDNDECTLATHNCDSNANCTNTAGSFSCACNSGYNGNGTSCTDVDECAAASPPCDSNANCTNTAGSYSCACNSGYTGSGTTCTDIDECANSTLNNCHANATCTNTNASFTCACNNGFSGNGVSCISVSGSLEYCFRAVITVSATLSGTIASRQSDTETGVNAALTAFKSADTTLGYLSNNVTLERLVSTELITLLCFGSMSKTADELQAIFASVSQSATIAGLTFTIGDYDECPTNYPSCSSSATCTNSNGSYSCVCPNSHYDNSTSGSTGLECLQGFSYTCLGTSANVTLVTAYFTSYNINVTNIVINSNCNGTTNGNYYEYACGGVVTTNATHINAAFTVLDTITTYSTNRLNTTFYCTQLATQNITANLTAVENNVEPDIPIFSSSASTSLESSVFIGGFSNAATSGVSTGEQACIQLSDSNLGADIQIQYEDCWTGAPGDSAQFSLLNDYCPVDNTGLTVTTDSSNGGFCFTMHRPASSNVLEVIMQVKLCTAAECATPSCSKKKRSISDGMHREKRSSETRTVSTLIQIAPEDHCTRDCGVGACILDFARQQQCVCPGHSFKTDAGICVARTLSESPSNNNDDGSSISTQTVYVLVGLAVLLLVLVVVFVVVFTVRKRHAATRKDYELSYVNST